jgi:hypothetical protein
VLNNTIPWFEVKPISLKSKYQTATHGATQQYTWQAIFACQINVRPFDERLKFRWGFAPAFLLEEAVDRQKLFVESQLLENPFANQSTQRTLALRCISIPKSGIQLGLVAKVLADTQKNAEAAATMYWYELESTFPYDYAIYPATSPEKFNQLTGKEILEKCNNSSSIAQIRRYEYQVPVSKAVFHMFGAWQASIRSNEQVWRALANYPQDLLLNIQIRPTILSEDERVAILEIKNLYQNAQDKNVSKYYAEKYDAWVKSFVDRHTQQWSRYLYLQIHLASPTDLREYIFRSIGSSITRDTPDQHTPGYKVDYPSDSNQVTEWANHLDCLEFVRARKNNRLPRLSELANLEEAHAVFRLPFPPEPGFPNTEFLNYQEEQ